MPQNRISKMSGSRSSKQQRKSSSSSPLVVLVENGHDDPGSNKLMAPQSLSALSSISLLDVSSPDKTCSKAYWINPMGGQVYELYGMDSDDGTIGEYSSFLVNGIVVPNGVLHTLTKVDPLWFVVRLLAPHEHNELLSSSWKPLDQLLGDICGDHKTTRDFLVQLDATHFAPIFQSMELSEEEMVYKLSQDKVVSWLTRKQQGVETVLRLQAQRTIASARTNDCRTTTCFAQGLFVPGRDNDDDDKNEETITDDAPTVSAVTNATAADDTTMTIDDGTARTIRDESIQVVCQYLSKAWRNCFLHHLQLLGSDVLEGKSITTSSQRPKKIKPTVDWNAGLTDSTMTAAAAATSSSVVVVTPKIPTTGTTMTAGAKRLQKVNTKGMSKLSSFFATKPKQK
jgi:hypothetical protein